MRGARARRAATMSLAVGVVIGCAASAGADDHVHILRKLRLSDQKIILIGFDHVRRHAFRALVDERSGETLHQHIYPGRPQSSRSEFEQAVSIIARDTALANLLVAGAVADGGFIVDGPPGRPPSNRYIQIRLLTPTRTDLLRIALVDLTEEAIVSVQDWFE